MLHPQKPSAQQAVGISVFSCPPPVLLPSVLWRMGPIRHSHCSSTFIEIRTSPIDHDLPGRSFKADVFPVLHDLNGLLIAHVAEWDPCNMRGVAHISCGWICTIYADPAQPLATAGGELPVQ